MFYCMEKLYLETPLMESLPMGKPINKNIYLKLECCQPAGSFKIRGIGHMCIDKVKKGVKHLVASSGGNAGLAVAYSGRKLGVKVTVFVPQTTPKQFQEKIKLEGAELKVVGNVWDETHLEALKFTDKVNGAYIPPFDHPLIWQGHSSMIGEVIGKIPKADCVILSVGGGGLLCGVVEGLQKNSWSDVPVIAAETEGTASLTTSIKAGKLVSLENINGIAKSLGAKKVAQRAFELTKEHPIIPVTVTDAAALKACIRFANDHRYIVEPACGASLAVVYNNPNLLESKQNILVIVCGGNGTTLEMLRQ